MSAEVAVADRSAGRLQRPRAGPDTGRAMLSRRLLLLLAAVILMMGTWLSLMGPISPLMVIAGAAGLVVIAPRPALMGLARCWPLWFVVILPMASSLWSTDPAVSLRYGTQLSITVVCGIILASAIDLATLLRVMFVSSALVLLLCFTSNRYDISPEGPVWIGVLGSKNQMGQLCQMVICSALAVAVSKAELKGLRAAGVGMALVATTVMAATFSAGAIVTTLVFLLVVAVLRVGSRLASGAKVLLAGVVGLMALPLILIRDELYKIYVHVIVNILHKDVGLTGRDYLWEHADRMISLRPLLGYGYRSTWLGSGAETIGLLRWARISSGAGFNFHDTFREWAVDFGLPGAALVMVCLAIGMFRVVARNFTDQATAAGIFLAASVVVVVTRAKVEFVFGPFVCSTVFIVAIAATGYLQTRAKTPRPVRFRSPPRRETRRPEARP